MAQGPGKYDAICTLAREAAEAEGAIVIILGGNQGSGFSVQSTHPDIQARLPDLLESVASQIREASEYHTKD